MNYLAINDKLNLIRQRKLHTRIELQREISDIDHKIRENIKLHLKANQKSIDCIRILSGNSRDNIRNIIKFLILSMHKTEVYFEAYRDIDVMSLFDNNEFFDFAIVEIGAATIEDIKKKFDKVEIKDDEMLISTKHGSPINENSKIRLWKKLTKKSIINEAVRISNQMK